MTTSSLYSSVSALARSGEPDVLTIVAMVVGICGAITLFFTFLSKNNEGKFSGFLGMVYDTFTFKKFWLKPLLKVTYLMSAIYTTISSFGYLSIEDYGWKMWLETLIVGNVVLRMLYEAGVMFVGMYENSKEIKEKLPGSPKPQGQPRPMAQQPVQRPVQQQPVQPVQPVQRPVQQQPVQPGQPQQ